MRVNIVVFWCAESGSWSEFSDFRCTIGLLFLWLCLFGMTVFVGMSVIVSMSVIVCVIVSMSVTVIIMSVIVMLAVLLLAVLVMLAMLGNQCFSVRNLVDAVLGVLTVFEAEVMRVDDDLL